MLLNNELDDFAAKPGAPNAYRLIGERGERARPRQAAASSMSPTFVLQGRRAQLATGSPGGSRIITTVLQILVNTIDHGLNVAEATNAPRARDQLWPDEIMRSSAAFRPTRSALLQAMGHKVELDAAIGSANSIARAPDGLLWRVGFAAEGTLAVGY